MNKRSYTFLTAVALLIVMSVVSVAPALAQPPTPLDGWKPFPTVVAYDDLTRFDVKLKSGIVRIFCNTWYLTAAGNPVFVYEVGYWTPDPKGKPKYEYFLLGWFSAEIVDKQMETWRWTFAAHVPDDPATPVITDEQLYELVDSYRHYGIAKNQWIDSAGNVGGVTPEEEAEAEAEAETKGEGTVHWQTD